MIPTKHFSMQTLRHISEIEASELETALDGELPLGMFAAKQDDAPTNYLAVFTQDSMYLIPKTDDSSHPLGSPQIRIPYAILVGIGLRDLNGGGFAFELSTRGARYEYSFPADEELKEFKRRVRASMLCRFDC